MKKDILIYDDDGVGSFSLYAVREYFRNENVTFTNSQTIIDKGIPPQTDIFIMPGGADRPYARKLNGAGNIAIKKYVQDGGIYLGICAGAYYGAKNIEFQKGSKHEICEARELCFYKGVAIGCLNELTNTYDQTLNSAEVTFMNINEDRVPVLYWGGCYFSGPDQNTQILARYEQLKEKPPAIILCSYGRGRAILSGVHFEVSQKILMDYKFDNQSDENNKITLAEKLISPIKVKDIIKQSVM